MIDAKFRDSIHLTCVSCRTFRKYSKWKRANALYAQFGFLYLCEFKSTNFSNRCSQFKWARIVYANARTNIYPFMDDSTIKTKWKKIYKYMSCQCNLEAPIKRTGRYFFLCSVLLFAIIEWFEWIVECCFFCILVLGDHFRRTWHRHKRWIFRWYWSTTRTHQCLLQWSFR